MTVTKIRNVTDVAEVTGRGHNWVRDAANTGALASLPRTGRKHQFTDEMVEAWIKAGTPQFPPARITRQRSA